MKYILRENDRVFEIDERRRNFLADKGTVITEEADFNYKILEVYANNYQIGKVISIQEDSITVAWQYYYKGDNIKKYNKPKVDKISSLYVRSKQSIEYLINSILKYERRLIDEKLKVLEDIEQFISNESSAVS